MICPLAVTGAVAGADERGRLGLLDHRRTGDLGAGGKRRPPQDARLSGRSGSSKTTSPALVRHGSSGVHGCRQPAADGVLHPRHGDHQTQIDDLDRLIGRRLAVALVVLLVEAQPRGVRVSPARLGAVTGIGDGVLLAAIAQVGGEGEAAAGEAVARELTPRRPRNSRIARTPPRPRFDRAQLADQRADEILTPLRHQHAERREGARQLGDDHRGMKISRAIATACSGPAPPNAISVVSRGSMPRLTETARTASDMAPSAMVMIPSAASTVRA